MFDDTHGQYLDRIEQHRCWSASRLSWDDERHILSVKYQAKSLHSTDLEVEIADCSFDVFSYLEHIVMDCFSRHPDSGRPRETAIHKLDAAIILPHEVRILTDQRTRDSIDNQARPARASGSSGVHLAKDQDYGRVTLLHFVRRRGIELGVQLSSTSLSFFDPYTNLVCHTQHCCTGLSPFER